ncbi:hypothetical protein ABNQ39_05640 [Azospirillum sp. A26]|uniref:hypothetical protein n=1 Tax=Azospirillum sp. A26 TaxID=3160607 RepID=UPI00366DAC42
MGFSAIAAATVASAGIGAMSASSSAKAQAKAAEKGQTTTTVPWAEQQPYLTDAWQKAQANFASAQNTPYYQGNLYTGLNDVQKAGLSGITNWAGTNGGMLAGKTTNASVDALTRGGFFADNAVNGAAGSWGAGVPGDQSSAMAAFGTGALGNSGALNSAIMGTIANAQNDPTKVNIAAAGQYADNPYLQSQIDAASADVTDQLGTGLVGLNNQASAGGNLNSSRAGAAEAEMRGQAARTIGNMSATMRSNAYQSGLQLAEGARQANAQTNLGALSAGLNFTGQGLNALNGAQDARNAEIGNRITSNGQLAGQTGLGFQGADLSNNIGLNNAGAVLSAGGVYQSDANNQNQADFQRWQGQDTRSTDLLKRYYEIVGSNGWGGTKTETGAYAGQGAGASALQGAIGGGFTGLGMLGTGMNLYNTYFKTPAAPSYTGGGMVGNNALGGTGMLGGGV